MSRVVFIGSEKRKFSTPESPFHLDDAEVHVIYGRDVLLWKCFL